MNDEYLERIRTAAKKHLKISPESIEIHSSLKDDLGIDSVDGLDLAFALEKEFQISISDKELAGLKTVSQLIALVKQKMKD